MTKDEAWIAEFGLSRCYSPRYDKMVLATLVILDVRLKLNLVIRVERTP